MALADRVSKRRTTPTILHRHILGALEQLGDNGHIPLRRRKMQCRAFIIVRRGDTASKIEEHLKALEVTLPCQLTHLARRLRLVKPKLRVLLIEELRDLLMALTDRVGQGRALPTVEEVEIRLRADERLDDKEVAL